jgi:hypothetical protein
MRARGEERRAAQNSPITNAHSRRLCGLVTCDLTRAGLASGCDGDDGLVRGRYGAHVSGVRRAGVLGARQQEAVEVLRPARLRERCDVGTGGRTCIRNEVQRASPAVIRSRVGGAVARRAGRGARVLLPHVRTVPGLVRRRRERRTRFRSTTTSAGSTSPRRAAGGCRPVAEAQALSRPVQPARPQPAATGSRAGAARDTGRTRPHLADSAGLCNIDSGDGCSRCQRRGGPVS